MAGHRAGGAAMREEIDLFGGPDLLFGCRHPSAEPSGTGVLVCLGALSDSRVDDGRAARLGCRLAASGVAAQRFHYRGDWPSDGDPRSVGFDDLVADAARALDLLRDRAGATRVAFVGSRLGALVAARLARAVPGAPVALWAPVPDPRAALEQAARARRQRVGEVDAPLDVFDTLLAVELAQGTVRSLVEELGEGPRPVLLAIGPAGGEEAIVPGLRARGLAVDVVPHTYDVWRDGRPVPGVPADALVDGTTAWLLARLAPEAAG